MTSSIPDSVSMSDLEKFSKKAQAPVQKPLYNGLTKDEVEELAMKTLRDMSRKCNDPMVEKCMMLAISASWVRWHTEMAQEAMPATADSDSDKSEGATDFATCLLRDAGKAQAIYTLVRDIIMDNDFVMNPGSGDSE